MSADNFSLLVVGLGPVPSFKNKKLLTRGRLITKPERQEWMEKCIQSFESQLRSAIQTRGDGTLMEQSLRSLIVWSRQFDDSRQWIPKQVAEAEDGPDSACVTIEQL